MIFIVLSKLRGKPTKESIAGAEKLFAKFAEEGGKFLNIYWTLGKYDAVAIIEGKDEKAVMKALMRFGDSISTKTLVALPREEAIKLIE